MSVMEYDPPTMTRGDLKPDLEATLGDARGVANFSAVDPDMVTVVVVLNGAVIVEDVVDDAIPSPDGKTVVVTREWQDGETAESGRMWVCFRINWPGAAPQTFPEDSPLIMNIRPAPGDA